MRSKRKVFVLILLSVLTILNASSAFAKAIVYGSEEKGYMVSSQQLRTNEATYNASELNDTYKSYASGGAKLWNKTDVVTFKQSKNSPNYIRVIKNKNTNTVALCTRTSISATGQILAFEITYNKSLMKNYSDKVNNATAAHEFGHALGLQDLYNNNNTNQIMYGYVNNRTATKPSAKDIKGAKYATRD